MKWQTASRGGGLSQIATEVSNRLSNSWLLSSFTKRGQMHWKFMIYTCIDKIDPWAVSNLVSNSLAVWLYSNPPLFQVWLEMWQPDVCIFRVNEGHSRMWWSMSHCLHPVQGLDGVEPALPATTCQVFPEKYFFINSRLSRCSTAGGLVLGYPK